MLNPYRSPAGRYRCQTIIRRSIFTATLSPVVSPEEAHMFWNTVRHEFRDASHHGFACRTGTDSLYEKSSDDGEPAGTAGHPILSVMQKKKITKFRSCCIPLVRRHKAGYRRSHPRLQRRCRTVHRRSTCFLIFPISEQSFHFLMNLWVYLKNMQRFINSVWMTALLQTAFT